MQLQGGHLCHSTPLDLTNIYIHSTDRRDIWQSADCNKVVYVQAAYVLLSLQTPAVLTLQNSTQSAYLVVTNMDNQQRDLAKPQVCCKTQKLDCQARAVKPMHGRPRQWPSKQALQAISNP